MAYIGFLSFLGVRLRQVQTSHMMYVRVAESSEATLHGSIQEMFENEETPGNRYRRFGELQTSVLQYRESTFWSRQAVQRSSRAL